MLLAIDTSAGTNIAVVDLQGELIAERATDDTRRHAEVLGEFLAELAPTALSAVVVGVGPGPFTGLRVGIAAAHGFAWGAQLPLWPVLSHDAIALTRYCAGHNGALQVATDARRREFFVSDYLGLEQGVPHRIASPKIAQVQPAGDLAVRVSAADLARVALARQAAGLAFEPADAVYLRSPDVTIPKVAAP